MVLDPIHVWRWEKPEGGMRGWWIFQAPEHITGLLHEDHGRFVERDDAGELSLRAERDGDSERADSRSETRERHRGPNSLGLASRSDCFGRWRLSTRERRGNWVATGQR